MFRVQELERTRRFYADALGLELSLQDDYLPGTLPSGTELLFRGRSRARHLAADRLRVDEGGIGTAVEALVEREVQVLTSVSEAPGGWSIEFKDPDDHPLAFFQAEALPRRR